MMENILYQDSGVTIRQEMPDDYREVESLTREAFWNVYAPGCTEHYLLHRLRHSPDFIPELDIVAECGGEIVGNVVCVRSYIEGKDGQRRDILTLGPISVLPACQRKGIGRKMTEYITDAAGRMGYRAILLCGDPLLYVRYGFEPAGKYGIMTSDGRVSPALQIYPLNGTDITGYSGRYFESPAYDMDIAQAEEFDLGFPAKEKLSDTPSQRRFKELLQFIESNAQ